MFAVLACLVSFLLTFVSLNAHPKLHKVQDPSIITS